MVDFTSPLMQAVIIVGIVGFITLIAILKLYVYLTCGKFRARTKMDGKTVIITGATGGIGKETAKELARRGARVILACRNVNSANVVRDEIIELTGNNNVIVKQLDLSSQKSVRDFAADFLKTEKQLHVLIHNAGTAEMLKKIKTEDGIEYTMATNHYGPFLLTHLLIDVLKRTAPSRIVIVASELYKLSSVNLDNLNPIDTFPAYLYYVSKFANIYFCKELSRRLEGTNVTANCLHPGLIDTGIWRNVPFPLNYALMILTKGLFKTPEQGAQTSLYLAVSDEVEGVSGKYYMDCKEADLIDSAQNMTKAKKLWEKSAEIVKLSPSDPKI